MQEEEEGWVGKLGVSRSGSAAAAAPYTGQLAPPYHMSLLPPAMHSPHTRHCNMCVHAIANP